MTHKPTVRRLIVFGDSLSDIGVKRNTGMGQFAALLGLMRTNQVNRFSDNRNWTDFIWEWAGGAPLIFRDKKTSDTATARHLAWGPGCAYGSAGHNSLCYANYAEGGAMGGSDRSGLGLGTFRAQARRYLNDLKNHPPGEGHGLYLIWFGLNDLVTNDRNPDDMRTVAREMGEICAEIARQDSQATFLFGNLPNPQTAVRYTGKEETSKVLGYVKGALNFGHELAVQLRACGLKQASVVDIYTAMDHVGRNLASYQFTQARQPHGIEVRYGADPRDPLAARCTCTSDGAHPTEAVYRIIAQIWSDAIRQHVDLPALCGHPDARFVVKGTA